MARAGDITTLFEEDLVLEFDMQVEEILSHYESLGVPSVLTGEILEEVLTMYAGIDCYNPHVKDMVVSDLIKKCEAELKGLKGYMM